MDWASRSRLSWGEQYLVYMGGCIVMEQSIQTDDDLGVPLDSGNIRGMMLTTIWDTWDIDIWRYCDTVVFQQWLKPPSRLGMVTIPPVKIRWNREWFMNWWDCLTWKTCQEQPSPREVYMGSIHCVPPVMVWDDLIADSWRNHIVSRMKQFVTGCTGDDGFNQLEKRDG